MIFPAEKSTKAVAWKSESSNLDCIQLSLLFNFFSPLGLGWKSNLGKFFPVRGEESKAFLRIVGEQLYCGNGLGGITFGYGHSSVTLEGSVGIHFYSSCTYLDFGIVHANDP